MGRSIPIAVSTGSLYPLPTLESIQRLNELGIRDVELTLQSNEFFLTFERKLSMPILPKLQALVQRGELRVCSVHAPSMPTERPGYNLWARLQLLIHSIEVCHLLGGDLVVIHPFHFFQIHEAALDYLARDSSLLPIVLLPRINDALHLAYSTGIKFAIENIQDWQDEVFFNAPENVSRFLQDMDHSSLGFTLDLMHTKVAGSLDEFIHSLSDEILNNHASDLLPPIKRVAIGKGAIDWDCLIPNLQTLPNLRQFTVELSDPQTTDIIESVKFLSSFMS